jgi:hypothetical protein
MIRTTALARFTAVACVGVTLAACSSGGGPSRESTPPTSASSSATGPAGTITPDMARAMAGAARAATALISYDYRHLDTDHANTVRYLAEPFRSQYETSWQTITAKAPPERAVVKGRITDFAISQVRPDAVDVLLYGEQTITNKQLTSPRIETIALRVTVRSPDWNITELEEVGSSTNPSAPSTAWASPDLAAALLAARQCVTTLNSLDRRKIDAQLQAMLGCTTGQLHTQLNSQQAELRSAAAKATTVGKVTGIGVSSVAVDHCVLLVAVSTSRTPGGAASFNRLVVTMQYGSGHWLMSQVDSE